MCDKKSDYEINHVKIPIESDNEDYYLNRISILTDIPVQNISIIKILSKELVLKDLNQFYYDFCFVIRVHNKNTDNLQVYLSIYKPAKNTPLKTIKTDSSPIIIGFGPAGIFAALQMIKYGISPLIFERGKKIEERVLDVENFIANGILNPQSNIQFGEGGAGSFSDGKLFSRRNKNTSIVNQILKTFVKFGAPAEIEFISKPHLGTDVIRRIIKNIRLYILDHGGKIFYNSQMTDLIIKDGQCMGVVINSDEEFLSSSVFVAIGHSARETVLMMQKKGVNLLQRPINVGVRIEHPVHVINMLRYGKKYFVFKKLGAAAYSINYTNRSIKRGVYTFCMCPGGEIVNASSQEGHLVLNGMSYYARASKFSNSALVVNCKTDDYKNNNLPGGLEFQKEIERKSFAAGGENWNAPAENLMHFLQLTKENTINESSYKMGLTPACMRDILPPFIIEQLTDAFKKWKSELPLFVSENALLLGSETRTSSPVKIVRDNNYESTGIKKLYPIGEGSGYSGGITSSASDGIRAVKTVFLRE